jgi:hypothetical protein
MMMDDGISTAEAMGLAHTIATFAAGVSFATAGITAVLDKPVFFLLFGVIFVGLTIVAVASAKLAGVHTQH